MVLIDFDAMLFTCPAAGEFPRLQTNLFASASALTEGFSAEYKRYQSIPLFSDQDWRLLRLASHLSGLTSLLKRFQKGNPHHEAKLRHVLQYWDCAEEASRAA